MKQREPTFCTCTIFEWVRYILKRCDENGVAARQTNEF
jgi:hypothetical protein